MGIVGSAIAGSDKLIKMTKNSIFFIFQLLADPDSLLRLELAMAIDLLNKA
jgi:hypothetical protein